MKMTTKRQSVTLSLPRRLVRRAETLAAAQNTSLSSFLAGILQKLVDDRDAYERAKERALAHLRDARPLGTKGRITWTRDSLHERR